MTVKERRKFDSLVSRILFLELAFSAAAVSILVFFSNPITDPLTIIFGGGFVLLGLLCLYSCCLLSDKKVSKWAENTGNHELLIVFIGVAYGVAAFIRGSK